MNRISKKDFTSDIYKYLKPGEYILTYRGTECLQVSIKEIKGLNALRSEDERTPLKVERTPLDKPTHSVETKPEKIAKAKSIPNVKTADEIWKEKQYRMTHYGCGCSKTEGKLLCSKHNRT